MEDLKKVSLRTTHLVFDEMRFDGRDDDTAGRESKLSPQELIKLLDVEHNRSISARYKDAQIPKGMPRIFTTNSPLLPHDHFFPRGRDAVEQYAIDSRYIKKGWLANDIRDDAMHAALGVHALAHKHARKSSQFILELTIDVLNHVYIQERP